MSPYPIFALFLLATSVLAIPKPHAAFISQGGLEQEIEEAFFLENRGQAISFSRSKRQAEGGAFTAEAGFVCNEAEKDQLFEVLDACIANADEEFVGDLAGGNVRSSLCISESSKLKCWRNNLRQCWTQEGANRIFFGHVISNLEKYEEQKELLGENFADTCPDIRRAKEEVIIDITGSTKCNWPQVKAENNRLKACRAQIKEEVDNGFAVLRFLSGSNRRNHLVRILCNEDKGFKQCLSQVKCNSQSKMQKILDNLAKQNRDLEAKLDGFSFARSCSGIN